MAIVSINPFTEEEIERFAETSEREVEAALANAELAFGDWRTRSLGQRGQVLNALAKVLHKDRDMLARMATLEMGKPLAEALAEVDKCARTCEWIAENGERMLRDEPHASNASESYVAFEPLGCVLAVMPWNFPYWQAVRALAPALMAGNVMLLKHASNVSRCSLEIARVVREAGAPEGVFASLLLPSQAIEKLIADRRVVAATLTGSEGAGAAVAKACGAALKKTVLELGGSDPFIVLADADVAQAAAVAVKARFQNNGQSCIAAKRFIVVREQAEAFMAHFAEGAAKLRMGDPLSQETTIGPLAKREFVEVLRTQEKESVAAGAKARTFGERPARGFFYAPTMLSEVTETMPAFRDETFGPLAAIVTARDEAHAIALANRSHFGLGSALWTRDLDRAKRLARQIEAGSVFVNGMVASDARLPFGGIKKSGYGRELSAFGLREFTNVKTIWLGPSREDHATAE
jgi:succinate-semialdehyde dehydrogenase/glutarate-semialdehyde dehydrogenase